MIRGGHWNTLFFLSFPFFLYFFFLYSFISSFFSIVTFLGWTRLQATWIKPEVVATKKYTGCLHYRFITTWSRFLWSPCCSYMCFFEFLYGPANCLSVYDIVFPMFWTFLWWVNGSVSGPILHMLIKHLSDYRTVGPQKLGVVNGYKKTSID
jgi:hypothetical protein